MDASKLLAPYRVLDLTDERGLLAGRMLADLGADVIAIEPIGGSSARRVPPRRDDGGSAFWAAYAANKRGIALDLSIREGADILRRLVANADFVFESAEPGQLGVFGISYEDLRAVNPALVHVSITAFGSTGPKAGLPATDITLWAAGGPLLPVRDDGRPPLRITVPQAWLHAAGDAAGGAMVAHFARLQDGCGQRVDISAQRSVMEATLSRVLAHSVGDGDSLVPAGMKVYFPNKWQVADGYIELGIGMGTAIGHFTNNFMRWLGEIGDIDSETAALDWRTMQTRIAAGETTAERLAEIRETITGFLGARTKVELMQAAVDRKLMIAPVFTVEELARSPHLADRGFWQHASGVDGGETYPTFPALFDGMRPHIRRPAPGLGEHTDEVLGGELGVTAADLVDLRKRGVIR